MVVDMFCFGIGHMFDGIFRFYRVSGLAGKILMSQKGKMKILFFQFDDLWDDKIHYFQQIGMYHVAKSEFSRLYIKIYFQS